MTRTTHKTPAPASALDRMDDEDYPAYSMGRAAELLGVTQGFLRSLGEAKLIEPLRSQGGHRRFSRYQLRLAQRARELVDAGTALDAACRIIILEDQLAEAQRINQMLKEQSGNYGQPADKGNPGAQVAGEQPGRPSPTAPNASALPTGGASSSPPP